MPDRPGSLGCEREDRRDLARRGGAVGDRADRRLSFGDRVEERRARAGRDDDSGLGPGDRCGRELLVDEPRGLGLSAAARRPVALRLVRTRQQDDHVRGGRVRLRVGDQVASGEEPLEHVRVRGVRVGLARVDLDEREHERGREVRVDRAVWGLREVLGEVGGERLAELGLALARPRVRELHPRGHLPAAGGDTLGERGDGLVARGVELDDRDAAAGDRTCDEARCGGVEERVALREVGGCLVEVSAQLLLVGTQGLDLAGELVADRLLERACAQHDAHGERQEHRDEGDEVVAEVDHGGGSSSVGSGVAGGAGLVRVRRTAPGSSSRRRPSRLP